MNIFRPLLAAAMLVIPAVMAQERAAGQAYDAQVNWSILSSKIEAVNVRNQALQAVIDQMKLCGAAGKVYAPGTPSADSTTGCVSAGSGGAPDAVLQDEKPSKTNGGSNSVGVWTTRTLNTKAYDPGNLITLSASKFTPASNAWVEWSCPGYTVGHHQTRLFNVTDGTAVSYGTSTYSSATSTDSRSEGGSSLIAGKTYRIEHWFGGSHGTEGQGLFGANGNVQIYCRAKIWKN